MDVGAYEDGVEDARLDGKLDDVETRLWGDWSAVSWHAADFGSWGKVVGILG